MVGFIKNDGDNNPTFVVRLAKTVNMGGTATTTTTEKPLNATAAPSTNGTVSEAAAEARAEDEPEIKTMKIFDIAQYGSTFEDAREFNDVT